MLEESLAKLGFSPSEVTIYLHLIKTGSSYPKVISAKTGINRTNVYEALDRLISKGVVSSIVKNKLRWFEAKSPDCLISMIGEREVELSKVKDVILNDLKSLSIPNDTPQLEATIFVGKKGLRMIFEEILEKRKSISLFASQLQFEAFFGPYFELWHKKRIAFGISQRSIFSSDFKQRLKKRDLLTYKFVGQRFVNPTTTIIYGDCCVLIQWSEEPLVIRINNKSITRSHLNYFDLIWNS